MRLKQSIEDQQPREVQQLRGNRPRRHVDAFTLGFGLGLGQRRLSSAPRPATANALASGTALPLPMGRRRAIHAGIDTAGTIAPRYRCESEDNRTTVAVSVTRAGESPHRDSSADRFPTGTRPVGSGKTNRVPCKRDVTLSSS
ncbi:hypothetical protein [Natronorubrum sediminis]|uniref:hypothetical protein n=1 Tax=Natronorubrum sediminis TaxID=640943 RepID=UPI0011152653|nr:hypothetical protein [Natronorubrum sediminis]